MNKIQSYKINALPALLFWGMVWQLLAAAVDNPLLLPGPLQVLRCLGSMIRTAAFWQITGISIGRILLGMVSATCLAVLLGIATAGSRIVNALIAPAMTAMQATPVASFTILVLLWLERDWVPVLICAMMVMPVVWQSVHTGILMTDRQLLEMASVFRLSPVQILRRIYVPSVMPFFRSACSSALGLGWKAGIAAEVLTVPRNSIGRMLSESKLYLLSEELFAWTMTVVILSLILQKVMLRLLNRRGTHA